jgi:hypothetical protein
MPTTSSQPAGVATTFLIHPRTDDVIHPRSAPSFRRLQRQASGLLRHYSAEKPGGTDSAHHHCNLCRLGSSLRDFGASCPRPPSHGHCNRTHHLPSYRASGPRVRVRAAAHPLVRAVGLLALGPLRSENVGKSTSPSIFAIGKVWMAGWGITYYLFYRPRQNI